MVVLPILGSGARYELHPQKIIAVGLNYREHVDESPTILLRSGPSSSNGTPVPPPEPILFAKTPNVLIGPGETIVIPSSLIAGYAFAEPRTDYEAELAIIIGRRCKDVPPEAARSCIFGYTCFNDVSQRNIQNFDRSGWFRGKSFDTFGPVGPAILPDELIGNPQSLAIECRLNGRKVQGSNTAAMIFGVAELVSFISRNFALESGDIIATGTPSGVGRLAAGDVVEIEIEGIGTLRNPVAEE
jgi:2-keto-4-pentenoate hydratase/2-oxohepta-3-ene-1,7-dioic acid hydratase in catechol pathway